MEMKIWNTIIATSNPWLRKSIKKIMEKVGSKEHGGKHENMKSYTKIRIEKRFFFSMQLSYTIKNKCKNNYL